MLKSSVLTFKHTYFHRPRVDFYSTWSGPQYWHSNILPFIVLLLISTLSDQVLSTDVQTYLLSSSCCSFLLWVLKSSVLIFKYSYFHRPTADSYSECSSPQYWHSNILTFIVLLFISTLSPQVLSTDIQIFLLSSSYCWFLLWVLKSPVLTFKHSYFHRPAVHFYY